MILITQLVAVCITVLVSIWMLRPNYFPLYLQILEMLWLRDQSEISNSMGNISFIYYINCHLELGLCDLLKNKTCTWKHLVSLPFVFINICVCNVIVCFRIVPLMIDLFWRCLSLLRSTSYCFLKCRNFAILFTTQEETYPLHHQYQIKIIC